MTASGVIWWALIFLFKLSFGSVGGIPRDRPLFVQCPKFLVQIWYVLKKDSLAVVCSRRNPVDCSGRGSEPAWGCYSLMQALVWETRASGTHDSNCTRASLMTWDIGIALLNAGLAWWRKNANLSLNPGLARLIGDVADFGLDATSCQRAEMRTSWASWTHTCASSWARAGPCIVG